MNKKTFAAVTAIGLAAAISIPAIAFGNARSNVGRQHAVQAAQTPFLASLNGANESPAGDADGVGAAAITFDVFNVSDPVSGAEVCWDLSYSGITGTPVMAHIHRGAAGVNGPIEVPITGLLATSATGCAAVAPALAQEIMATPSGFYVNVHTTDYGAGAIRGQLAVGPAPAGEAHLLPVPLRAYDSRDASGAKIAALETRTVSLANGKDTAGTSFIAVPPGATAAIVTLTVTETVGPGGFLKLYNAGIAEPATSSVNWAGTGQNIAVSTQVSVDASGQVKVTGGANATHFVIDVIGYLF
jgi:CHRD domain